MHKFFVDNILDETVIINKKDQHHILKVVRMEVGSQFIGIHNNVKYLCEILTIKPLKVKKIEQLKLKTKNDFSLNIFQANIKPKAMEFAIIKACELNVNVFNIFNAQYSQHDIKHNLTRYETLVKQASQQANRDDFMLINLIDQSQMVELLKTNQINVVAHLQSNNQQPLNQLFKHDIKSCGIIIGPEGGFTSKDLQWIMSYNTFIVELTKTILRAETAMIYLTSIISNYLLNKGN